MRVLHVSISRELLTTGLFMQFTFLEASQKVAGSIAFKKAVKEANPVLGGPIMNVSITVREHYGDIMGNLNSRRAELELIQR